MNGLVRRSFLAFGAAGFAAPTAFAQTRAEWAAIGQYGDKAAPVTVFEKDGALHIDGAGHASARLTATGRGRYAIAGGGELVLEPGAVQLNGTRLAFHDFGAETEAAIHAGVRADPEALRRQALAATPPVETGDFLPADLVDLTTVDPRIKLDIRYAGSNNFMGIPLYERAGAYLQRPAAEALKQAQAALAAQGYGLLIHDAYRPWFVTWMFWEATPPDARMFVANPAKGSRHNRGCAVDLTLYDLKTGRVVEMPSRYDEFSRSRPRRLRGRYDEAAGVTGGAARGHDRPGLRGLCRGMVALRLQGLATVRHRHEDVHGAGWR
ncbi:peptidase M15D vanX D-ala-D-ala dipeptidase [Caulobacter segnis ATCC 21756]|uniref:Peptidase M15D vanX D-ala-D-ala dipeptidase n=1 Tax=Caulobacter segnis (strain ATCC 21756 / DSM 7131 / JCM 7823 / NBRC 15250 / LMG 17158 / TK0059) TaxID=509190 RepID=D5VLK0_CAUST|nr:peptidase M15D vanX D-ala-D-ala dipeptidase [Caulobacter segnis ATCC 21756]